MFPPEVIIIYPFVLALVFYIDDVYIRKDK